MGAAHEPRVLDCARRFFRGPGRPLPRTFQGAPGIRATPALWAAASPCRIAVFFFSLAFCLSRCVWRGVCLPNVVPTTYSINFTNCSSTSPNVASTPLFSHLRHFLSAFLGAVCCHRKHIRRVMGVSPIRMHVCVSSWVRLCYFAIAAPTQCSPQYSTPD